MFAQNPSCQTMILQGANHDFPMHNSRQLNPILEKFFLSVSDVRIQSWT